MIVSCRYIALFLLSTHFLVASSSNRVRAARTDASFVELEDGTVLDSGTGVVWFPDANVLMSAGLTDGIGGAVDRAEALAWLDAMNAGEIENYGHDDWRLPSELELRRLFEGHEIGSDDPGAFVNVEPSGYWAGMGFGSDPARTFYASDGVARPGFALWPVRSEISSELAGASLLATDAIRIDDGARVVTGDVVVNAASEREEAELTFGAGVVTHPAGLGRLMADRIVVGSSSEIGSVLVAREVQGTLGSGIVEPPPSFPPVFLLGEHPAFREPNPGSENVVVRENGVLAIAPGRYAHVRLERYATLSLRGDGDLTNRDVFDVASVVAAPGTAIELEEPAELRVAGGLDIGAESRITGALNGPDAAGIIVHVAGLDLADGGAAVRLAERSLVTASVLAPNGTIAASEESLIRGALYARAIELGTGVEVVFAGAFAPPSASVPLEAAPEPSSASRVSTLAASLDFIGAAANANGVDSIIGDAWLFDQGSDSDDQFGRSMDVSGDWAIVGRPSNESRRAGKLYFYKRKVGPNGLPFWDLVQTMDAPNGGSDNDFGWSIDIDTAGEFAFVGAPRRSTTRRGEVYALRRIEPERWSVEQEIELLPFEPSDEAFFGWSVAVEDRQAIVGAPGVDGATARDVGLVVIYERDFVAGDFVWRPKERRFGEEVEGYNYGWSVAASDTRRDFFYASAPGADNGTGIVEVLRLDPPDDPTVDLVADPLPRPDLSFNQEFGIDVDASGDRVIVGTLSDEQPDQEAFIFRDLGDGSTDNWELEATLDRTDDSFFKEFGAAVGISGEVAVVGSPGNNLVEVFGWTGTEWRDFDADGDGNPDSVTPALAGDGEVVPGDKFREDRTDRESDGCSRNEACPGDRFGTSLAIDGSNLFVGAPLAEGTSTGSDNANARGFDSGHAYAFVLQTGAPPTFPTALTLGARGIVTAEFILAEQGFDATMYLGDVNGSTTRASVDDTTCDAPDDALNGDLSGGLASDTLLDTMDSRRGCRTTLDDGVGDDAFNSGDTIELWLCIQNDTDDATCEELWSTDPAKSSDGERHAAVAEIYTDSFPGRVFRVNWESGDDGLFDELVTFVRVGDDPSTAVVELDADADGLWDDWETIGVDVNGNAQIERSLGEDLFRVANPMRKDLFVEVDWMGLCLDENDPGCMNQHHHSPDVNALSDVRAAFMKAPVMNPDGTTGIDLHIDLSEEVPHEDVVEENFGGGSVGCGENHGSNVVEFDDIRNAFFPGESNIRLSRSGRLFTHRYAVFAHSLGRNDDDSLDGTSGCGELPGDEFLVTLGEWGGQDCGLFSCTDLQGNGTRLDQSTTFMHELGHTLGLLHGGDQVRANRKPNYLSVMSYNFQPEAVPVLSGGSIIRILDYSREALPDLDENNLIESDGLMVMVAPPISGSYTTSYYCDGTEMTPESVSKVNWNCKDGVSGTVDEDINNDGSKGTLEGFDDWRNIVYAFQATSNFEFGDVTFQELLREITEVEARAPLADAGAIADGDPFTPPGMPFEAYQCTLGASITLDGSGSLDEDGDIVSFDWDYPGGGVVDATGVSPEFTCDALVGSLLVTLTVTDDMDNKVGDEATILVRLDAGPDRVAECGNNVTLGAGLPENPALSYEWTLADGTVLGTTPSVTLSTDSATGELPLGVSVVTLTVTDERGALISDDVEVHVRDTAPPVVQLVGSAAPTLECNVDDYDELGALATDRCDTNLSTPAIGGDSVDPSMVGTYRVTYDVSDASGNRAEQKVRVVEVVDTLAPEIESVTATPNRLWPPNGRMHEVSLDVIAKDICTGDDLSCRIVRVISDEDMNGRGDGNTDTDWRILGNLLLELRAERSGPADGRTYSVVVACRDPFGNESLQSVDVIVPHDQDNGKARSVRR